MYHELFEAWKRELEAVELVQLAPDFYTRAADYLRRLREEGRMLDKRTVKARLLRVEIRNAKHILRELVQSRFRKLTREMSEGEKIPSEVLTVEEEKACANCTPIMEAYQNFARNLLRGQAVSLEATQQRRCIVLRFLKVVPEIIGADMKSYGPFKVEDVASLPVDNGKILVKQGLAEKVEII